MSKPVVIKATAAENKRVRDAMDAARDELFRMIRMLHLDEKNPAAARYENAISLVIRLLNDTDDDKIRKADRGRAYHRYRRDHAAADNLAELKDLVTPIHSTDARKNIISDLQQGRPPLRAKRGRRTLTLRDFLLARIVKNLRHRKFDGRKFDIHRNDATETRGSICSIVAAAWAELASEVHENREPRRTRLLEQGFAPLNRIFKNGLPAEARPLSESSLDRIWDESVWAAKARVAKERARKRRIPGR